MTVGQRIDAIVAAADEIEMHCEAIAAELGIRGLYFGGEAF